MSLYNALHGFEPTAPLVLELLKLSPASIPRFRDAYITYRDEKQTEPVMVVLTRTGGPNREDYADHIGKLCEAPGYIDNVDDEFDYTFALFRYELPMALHEPTLKFLVEQGPPLTLRQKTEQASGPDLTLRQRNASKSILEQLTRAMDGDADKVHIISI
jgi:hypothetical protein